MVYDVLMCQKRIYILTDSVTCDFMWILGVNYSYCSEINIVPATGS